VVGIEAHAGEAAQVFLNEREDSFKPEVGRCKITEASADPLAGGMGGRCCLVPISRPDPFLTREPSLIISRQPAKVRNGGCVRLAGSEQSQRPDEDCSSASTRPLVQALVTPHAERRFPMLHRCELRRGEARVA